MSLAARWAAWEKTRKTWIAAPMGGSLAGLPFMPNQFGPLSRILVEAAFGANLTADPNTWGWYDITKDVRQADGQNITITIGRQDEFSQAQPAKCTFQLKNSSGDYSKGPQGKWYPGIRLNTPIRVRLTVDGTNWYTRFQGYADGWPPYYDETARLAYVSVSASGVLRRLQQGTKPLRSALYRALTGVGVTNSALVPFAYWSFEDGRLSTQAVSSSTSIAPLPVTSGTVDFASITGAPGSDVQPDFSKGGQITGGITVAPNPTAWRAEFVVNVGPFGEDNPGSWVILDLFDTAGIDFGITVNNAANGGIAAFVGTTSSTIYSANSNKTCDDGSWHEIRMDAVQVGANASFQVKLDGTVILSTTLTTFTLHPFASTIVNGVKPEKLSAGITVTIPGSMGHLAIWYASVSDTDLDTVAVMRGRAGETVVQRLTRLCSEERIGLTLAGDSVTPMGPQGAEILINLLRDAEATDVGILHDGLGSGLVYRTGRSMYNQSASLSLTATAGQLDGPLTPADDDQRIRNKVTASSRNGVTPAAFEVTAGALGTSSVGTYDITVTVNPNSNGALTNIAAWIAHLGTVDEPYRYPTLALNLAAAAELAPTWLQTSVGNRIDITNLSSVATQHPSGTVSLLLEGYTETLTPFMWTAAANCSPYQPYVVGALGSSFRLELAGQTLAADLVPGATSLSLATGSGHQLFTTSAGYPADFPLDLNVGGWQVTCTSASGGSSPQALTINASPNVTTVLAGTPITLWRAAVLAL